jgi:hypothetical protein
METTLSLVQLHLLAAVVALHKVLQTTTEEVAAQAAEQV